MATLQLRIKLQKEAISSSCSTGLRNSLAPFDKYEIKMNILELEIHNIDECKHAHLKFNSSEKKAPLYLVHSKPKCEIINLALQLICGTKYANFSQLYKIRNKIKQGKVCLQFTLPKVVGVQKATCQGFEVREHSSDSDVPCTSREALQRMERRKRRYEQHDRLHSVITIKACRDFVLDPAMITYIMNNAAAIQCSVAVFHTRFFSCTEIIFPRLMHVSSGEYCQGKWLNLISMEFVDKGKEENHLIKQFCELYGRKKTFLNHNTLCKLTTTVLTARSYLNQARLSHLISIFNDIRWLFEYITCNEYTVWFLLPSCFGNLHDISQITAENVDFDLMKTCIQLKVENAVSIVWTRAEKHIQELLLVAIQLSFGYHCQQTIIYLHSLHELEKHQSIEFFNYSLIQACPNQQHLFFEKNYLQRIFNLCYKLNMCIILEYSGGLPFYPKQAYIIDCLRLPNEQECQIRVREESKSHQTNVETAEIFLQKLKESIN